MATGTLWRCTVILALLSLHAVPSLAQYSGYEEKSAGKPQWPIMGLNLRDQYTSRYSGMSTWPHSPNETERPGQTYLQAQPFLLYNLPQGWYFRSSANWSLETRRDSYYAPFSLGKVFKAGGTTYNMYAEPQWTAMPAVGDEPRFQMFFGLSLRLPQ